jgi:uncharacterized protein
MTDLLSAELLPDGLTPATFALVLVAALSAGWIDAVVGGGGLLQLPALLFVPGLSPVQALATNKLASICGTTLLRRTLGEITALRHSGRRHHGVAVAVGVAIGFYDSILGPGTGSFLVFAMVSLLGYDFLAASAKAKIVNWATNLAALLFFAPHGSVFWGLGIG